MPADILLQASGDFWANTQRGRVASSSSSIQSKLTGGFTWKDAGFSLRRWPHQRLHSRVRPMRRHQRVPRANIISYANITCSPARKPSLRTAIFPVFIPALNRLGMSPIGVFNLTIGSETPILYVLIPSTSLETLVSLS